MKLGELTIIERQIFYLRQSDIEDITLKFYNAANQLIISIDGGCGTACTGTASDPLYFGDTGTNLGNGGVGFVLQLDATQAAAVNAACWPFTSCNCASSDLIRSSIAFMRLSNSVVSCARSCPAKTHATTKMARGLKRSLKVLLLYVYW